MHPLQITTRQDKIDWLKARRLSIGASDIPVILGLSPYKTAEQLFAEKLDIAEPAITTSWPAERGKQEEPYIRDEYEEISGLKYPAKNFKIDFRTCSLDGYNDITNTGIEIKYASKKDHEMAIAGYVPEKYAPQVVWQYMVSKAKIIRYVSKRYGSVGEPLAIVQVPWPSDDIISDITTKTNDFWQKVLAERLKRV